MCEEGRVCANCYIRKGSIPSSLMNSLCINFELLPTNMVKAGVYMCIIIQSMHVDCTVLVHLVHVFHGCVMCSYKIVFVFSFPLFRFSLHRYGLRRIDNSANMTQVSTCPEPRSPSPDEFGDDAPHQVRGVLQCVRYCNSVRIREQYM